VRVDVLLLGLVLAAVLGWMFRRDQRRMRQWRAQLLSAVEPLLRDCRRSLDRFGFPVLQGQFQGHTAEVTLLADTIGVRRLPSLWIVVTLRAPIPGTATVDLLARPQNIEYYSPAETLPHRLYPPPDWPQHIQIKSDRADVAWMPLAATAKDFFTDPRGKEMLVTPRGVRLLRLVEQGRRGEYLLLRTARFELACVDPSSVAQVLQQCADLHQALSSAPSLSRLDHAA
jgi:hypothetical protein